MNHLKKFNETFFWNKKKKDKEPEDIDLQQRVEDVYEQDPPRYEHNKKDKYLGQLDEFDLYMSRTRFIAKYGDESDDFVYCEISEEDPGNFILKNARERAIELGYMDGDKTENKKEDKISNKESTFFGMKQSELRRFLRNEFVATPDNIDELVEYTKDFTEKELLAIGYSLGASGKIYCNAMKKKYKKNIKL